MSDALEQLLIEAQAFHFGYFLLAFEYPFIVCVQVCMNGFGTDSPSFLSFILFVM
jgi:hypothetical protein